MPLADQLVQARTEAGFSQDDVAAALGVSRAMVSYWESGARTPNDRQLVALSRLLRVSVGRLLGSEEPAPVPDLARMLLRSSSPEVHEARARSGLQEFFAFLDSYAQLAAAAKFPVRGMTQSPFVGSPGFEGADDARRKAEEVRSHLRVGLGAIGDLDAVCEMLGVTVYRVELGSDLSRTISGAFVRHPEVGFAIVVNLQTTPGRRRFTIAHELAHALFHSTHDAYTVSTATRTPRERFADAFAGELLMPTEGIKRLLEEQGTRRRVQDPVEVVHLQRFFGVSYSTALVRLRQARLMTEATFDACRNVRPVVLARSLGYEVADEEQQPRPATWRLERFPQRFRRLLRIAVHQGVLSVPSAAALTQVSLDEMLALVSPPANGAPDGAEAQELREFEDSGVIGAS